MAAEGACKGLSDELKLPLPSEKQSVQLIQWINEVKDHLMDYGMDTVFRVASIPYNDEQNLLEEWGLCEYNTWIDDWVAQLKQEVTDAHGTPQKVCHYDIQNLK